MTSLIVIWVPASWTDTEAALTELRALASKGDLIVDGPIEIKDSMPSSEAARLSRAAVLLKEASRRKRIAEGLARAKAEGRRIGRPPTDRPATTVQVVLDRARGRSWRSIEEQYRIPKTTARRWVQNARAKEEGWKG
jgi:hypothetical protein